MIVMLMDYAVAAPDVVVAYVQSFGYKVACTWEDLDDDFYELHISAYNEDEDDVDLAVMRVLENFVWNREDDEDDED